MKTLELNQMENLQGEGCIGSLGVLGIAMIGATMIAAPIAAGVWAAGFILGSVNAADACS